MFWKRKEIIKEVIVKEKMIDTSIGKISESTLKENKDLVKKMFETKIKEQEVKYLSIYKVVIDKIDSQVKQMFGECKGSVYVGVYGGGSYKHTPKSKKILAEIKKTFIKKKDVLSAVTTIDKLKEEMNELLN